MIRKPYHNPDVESAIRNLEREFKDSFKELERYLERELATLNRDGQILVKDAFNIDRINKSILPNLQVQARRLGFGGIMQKQTDRLTEMAKKILKEADDHGLPAKFTKTTGENIKALLMSAQRNLMVDEILVSQELEDLLRRSATGNVRWMDLVGRISDRLDVRMNQAMVKAANTISNFHTQIRVEHFENRDARGNIRGTAWFLYDGPRDIRNRDWCSFFVGTRVTMKILNEHATSFERRHPLPPSISLGGYNCRHELVPLVTSQIWMKYPEGPR